MTFNIIGNVQGTILKHNLSLVFKYDLGFEN